MEENKEILIIRGKAKKLWEAPPLTGKYHKSDLLSMLLILISLHLSFSPTALVYFPTQYWPPRSSRLESPKDIVLQPVFLLVIILITLFWNTSVSMKSSPKISPNFLDIVSSIFQGHLQFLAWECSLVLLDLQLFNMICHSSSSTPHPWHQPNYVSLLYIIYTFICLYPYLYPGQNSFMNSNLFNCLLFISTDLNLNLSSSSVCSQLVPPTPVPILNMTVHLPSF